MGNWVSSELNWNKPTINNGMLDKNLVFDLINSKNYDEASKSFWKLEDEVCKNRGLSEVAIDVTICILASLKICEHDAKQMCIDLLVEIISSEPIQLNSTVLDDCLDEIYENSWFFLYALEYGNIKNVSSYVDLICILSVKKVKLRHKAIIYLSNVLNKVLDKSEVPGLSLISLKNSIDELKNLEKNKTYRGRYPLR